MRSDAILVNVGHGSVLDGQALIEGLEQGQPAAVLLDGYSAAQLPDESPLRLMPNVIISPARLRTRAKKMPETRRCLLQTCADTSVARNSWGSSGTLPNAGR